MVVVMSLLVLWVVMSCGGKMDAVCFSEMLVLYLQVHMASQLRTTALSAYGCVFIASVLSNYRVCSFSLSIGCY
jgi:hypothetical protein